MSAIDRLMKQAEQASRRGELAKAIRIADEVLASVAEVGIERFGVMYYQFFWILESEKIAEARRKLAEMGSELPRVQPKYAKDSAVMHRYASAKLLDAQRKREQAIESYRNLLAEFGAELASKDFRAIRAEVNMRLGMLLADSGDWLEAGEFLKIAKPRKEFLPVLSFYLGQYFVTRRDFKSAGKCLKKAITRDTPKRWLASAHYMLGISELRLEQSESARRNLLRSLSLDGEGQIRRQYLWEALENAAQATGREAEAEKYRKLREEFHRKG
jgi:tetratricopeptide (TPR) repeat protein